MRKMQQRVKGISIYRAMPGLTTESQELQQLRKPSSFPLFIWHGQCITFLIISEKKQPDRINLKKEGLSIWLVDTAHSFMAEKTWRPEQEKNVHIASTIRNQREMDASDSVHFHLFIHFQSSAHRMVLIAFITGLPCSVKLFQKNPHRCVQRYVSQVIQSQWTGQ